MTRAPHRARRRARWALGALVLVNLVVLWFYVGASASLHWHAKMLDGDTLVDCSYAALKGQGRPATQGHRDVTFVGPATLRFRTSVTTQQRRREIEQPITVECEVSVPDDASSSTRLVVERARVVR